MTSILIVGAGATGGALGARLTATGQEVTFLVRERRAAQLTSEGLRFRAPDAEAVHTVRVVTSLEGTDPFDLVVITVKAPALAAIIPPSRHQPWQPSSRRSRLRSGRLRVSYRCSTAWPTSTRWNKRSPGRCSAGS
ncbi:hypothetical protein GCM10009689_16830 [Brevibacterium antiquum]|uniref:ketopantoate reductase family protein n=1 Tax=Brevibacterium antiquum TaxID=234835 RepID=UPI002FCCF486